MNTTSTLVTDTGHKRTHNEDSGLALDADRLYCVADGLGGHAAGEVASKIAVEVVSRYKNAFAREAQPGGEIDNVWMTIFNAANNVIFDNADKNPDHRGMGTTLTAGILLGDTFHIAHAGDSGVYLVRGGHATQLTDEHTVGAEYERENPGRKAAEQYHHTLTNCLGSRTRDAFGGIQYLQIGIVPGDLIIFATDGLLDYVEDEKQIAELVKNAKRRGGNPDLCKQLAGDLVQFALDAGGHDNITVVVVLVS